MRRRKGMLLFAVLALSFVLAGQQLGLLSSNLSDQTANDIGVLANPPARSVPVPSAPSGTNAFGHWLFWQDNSTNESGFYIESKRDTFKTPTLLVPGVWSRVATVAAGSTSFSLDEFNAVESNYCFRVQAYNSSGASAYSNEDCQGGTPLAPTELRHEMVTDVYGNPRRRFTWKDNSNIEQLVTFNHRRQTNEGTNIWSSQQLQPNTTTFSFVADSGYCIELSFSGGPSVNIARAPIICY